MKNFGIIIQMVAESTDKFRKFLIHLLGGYTSEDVQDNIQKATKILQEDLYPWGKGKNKDEKDESI